MGIRDKFRRRAFGNLGWAGGNAEEEVSDTPSARAENTQTQDGSSYHKPYKVGMRPPRKRRQAKRGE